MLNFNWHGGYEVDFDGLPEASRKAILSRVVGHFNNEAASAALSFGKRGFADAQSPKIKADAVTTVQSKEWRDANADATKQFVEEWFAEKLKEIREGTLGVRTGGGSAVDPLTREMVRIATEELRVLLEQHKLSLPTKDETISLAGREMTRSELVERQIGKNQERIEREAKAAIAARARKAKSIADGASASLAEALGL